MSDTLEHQTHLDRLEMSKMFEGIMKEREDRERYYRSLVIRNPNSLELSEKYDDEIYESPWDSTDTGKERKTVSLSFQNPEKEDRDRPLVIEETFERDLGSEKGVRVSETWSTYCYSRGRISRVEIDFWEDGRTIREVRRFGDKYPIQHEVDLDVQDEELDEVRVETSSFTWSRSGGLLRGDLDMSFGIRPNGIIYFDPDWVSDSDMWWFVRRSKHPQLKKLSFLTEFLDLDGPLDGLRSWCVSESEYHEYVEEIYEG